MEITLKELVTNGTRAIFSYACAGVLYYTVVVCKADGDYEYQFPVDMNNKEDVGTTAFVGAYKAITLMRYIRKAIESGNLIRVK